MKSAQARKLVLPSHKATPISGLSHHNGRIFPATHSSRLRSLGIALKLASPHNFRHTLLQTYSQLLTFILTPSDPSLARGTKPSL